MSKMKSVNRLTVYLASILVWAVGNVRRFWRETLQKSGTELKHGAHCLLINFTVTFPHLGGRYSSCYLKKPTLMSSSTSLRSFLEARSVAMLLKKHSYIVNWEINWKFTIFFSSLQSTQPLGNRCPTSFRWRTSTSFWGRRHGELGWKVRPSSAHLLTWSSDTQTTIPFNHLSQHNQTLLLLYHLFPRSKSQTDLFLSVMSQMFLLHQGKNKRTGWPSQCSCNRNITEKCWWSRHLKHRDCWALGFWEVHWEIIPKPSPRMPSTW